MRGELLRDLFVQAEPYLRKHATTILTSLGAAGVIATGITAAKAAPKAKQLLEEAKEKKGAELTKKEKFKVAVPAYIPATLVGVSTIACIFGAHVLSKREQAALASAYALLNTSYNEYRDKVKETAGEEFDQKIKNEIAKDKYDEKKVVESDKNDPEKEDICLFFDEYRGEYFESSIKKVRDAEYQLNRKMSLNSTVELNDLYELLDLTPTEIGAKLGWSMFQTFEFYGYSWLDFRCLEDTMKDGTKFYRIEPIIAPTYDFQDY